MAVTNLAIPLTNEGRGWGRIAQVNATVGLLFDKSLNVLFATMADVGARVDKTTLAVEG